MDESYFQNIDSYNLPVDIIHKPFWGYDFKVSPDGKSLIYLCKLDKSIGLYLMNLENNITQKVFEGTKQLGSVIWSPDSQKIAFKDKQGIIIYNFNKGTINVLANESCLYPAEFSQDGQSILAASQKGFFAAIELLDINGKWKKELYSEKGQIGDPNGYIRFRGVQIEQSLMFAKGYDYIAFVLVDLSSIKGKLVILEGKSGLYKVVFQRILDNVHCGFPIIQKWGAKGLIFSDCSTGHSKLYCLDLSNNFKISQLTFDTDNERNFTVSSDGQKVVYESILRNSCSSAIYIKDISTYEVSSIEIPKGVNYPVRFSTQDGSLYFVHSSSREVPDCWITNIKCGSCRRITRTAPHFVEFRLPEAQEVVIDSSESLTAKIIKPASSKYSGEKLPLLIWLRGGPTIYGLNEYIAFESWLANNGFIVCAVNYRGTVGYGTDFVNAVTEDGIGKKDVEDVLKCIQYCRKLENVDADRIGVAGVSYGGYLALRIMAMENSGIKAGFTFGAITDWHIQQKYSEVRHYDYWLLGKWLYHYDEFCISKSPIFEVEHIKQPLMLTHGCNDRDVPFKQAVSYVERSKKLGLNNIKYHFYENEGHGLPAFSKENYFHWHKLIIEFLNTYLRKWDFETIPYDNQKY